MAGPADLEGEAIAGKMKGALDRAKAGGKGSLYSLALVRDHRPARRGQDDRWSELGPALPARPTGALKGVGGTRNCDWWFADEAVLVDTAGRYTTQDSDAEPTPRAGPASSARCARRGRCSR